MISALPGVIWNGQTLPNIPVKFWEQYISLGGPGRAAEVVLGMVTAKDLIQIFCWISLNSENIIILKQREKKN